MKQQQIATTIKQSKYLISLGLNPETSDMFWEDYKRQPDLIRYPHSGKGTPDKDLPAWSLNGMLRVLPVFTQKNWIDGFGILINMARVKRMTPALSIEGSKWICQYTSDDMSVIKKSVLYGKTFKGDTAIEAVYKMLCFILKEHLGEL
jgi:hypothetical protein